MVSFFRAPLPAPLARQRLKGNLAGLALLTIGRTIFTPYLALRSMLTHALDMMFGDGSLRSHAGDTIVWWIETLITAVLLFNTFEAAYRVQNPSFTPPVAPGMKLVPVLKSSPLTRSYPPTPDLGSSNYNYTPTRTATASPLAQSLYKSTPTRSVVPAGSTSTPTRSSPLSASTARALNLQQPATSTSSGLFFDDSTTSSPSKVARPKNAPSGPDSNTASKPRSTGTYNIVNREEREWVDNVWKGVKGKSRKLGL